MTNPAVRNLALLIIACARSSSGGAFQVPGPAKYVGDSNPRMPESAPSASALRMPENSKSAERPEAEPVSNPRKAAWAEGPEIAAYGGRAHLTELDGSPNG